MLLLSKHCRPCRVLLLALFFVHCFPFRSAGGEEEFRLFIRPLRIPERGTVPSYVLQAGPRRFSFLPPSKWRVKENAVTREVVMMAPSLTTSLRLRILESNPEATLGEELAQWRTDIRQNYPEAKITAEFPCYASNVQGMVFDLERSTTNKVGVSTRLAFIPLRQGRAEFTLTTPRGKLGEHYFALANLLTSFHIEREAGQ